MRATHERLNVEAGSSPQPALPEPSPVDRGWRRWARLAGRMPGPVAIAAVAGGFLAG